MPMLAPPLNREAKQRLRQYFPERSRGATLLQLLDSSWSKLRDKLRRIIESTESELSNQLQALSRDDGYQSLLLEFAALLAKLPHSLEGKQVEHEFALQEDHTARVLRTTLGEDHYGDFVDANEAADSVVSMIEENRVRLSGLLSMAEHEQLDQLRNCADASLLALLIDLNEFDKMNVSLARRLAELAKEYAEQAFWLLHKKLKPDYKPDLVLTEPLVTSGPELTEVYESSDWTISRRRSSKS